MKVTLQVNGREIQKPMEEKWFDVNPHTINRNLFQIERDETFQEFIRNLILEAFTELDNHPEKYGKPFKTMFPKKTWDVKIVEELNKIATDLGDHMTDWVEQSLEWAQSITNGETWEDICKKEDTSNWYRLIVWKNGYAKRIGGSKADYNSIPRSSIGHGTFTSKYKMYDTVPSIVAY